MPVRTTETIAREVILGLLVDLQSLTAPENDNNPLPWSAAEDKALEIARVCVEVHKAIVARSLRPTITSAPATELHPILAATLQPFLTARRPA